ncbi:hypothetical protein NZK32_17335 [Cyanobium sp. FGCU-52]|nr:hypothetical protein [Cyanobium sp. FGCU52]
MSQTLLLSGPPGCGKTSWILKQIQSHSCPSAYLRLAGGGIASAVRDLEGERQRQQVVPQRKVIGIGSGLRYTLYDPGSDRIAFRTVGQQAGSRGRGFA